MNIAPGNGKTHRQHLRVGLGVASRLSKTYPMPVKQRTRARPQWQQQQARMGEPALVIVLVTLGRRGNGVKLDSATPLVIPRRISADKRWAKLRCAAEKFGGRRLDLDTRQRR
jgi:hypothetical protein